MMNKRSKLLYVWVAVSAAILIAGIVLFALFGFNTSLDRPAGKTVDVSYNVVVELSEENKNILSAPSEAVIVYSPASVCAPAQERSFRNSVSRLPESPAPPTTSMPCAEPL